MKRAIIDPEKCNNCVDCNVQKCCPMGAVFRETGASSKEKPWIDFYMCSGCLKCKTACLFEAIKLIVQPCTIKGRTTW